MTPQEALAQAITSLEAPVSERMPWWEADPEDIAAAIIATPAMQCIARLVDAAMAWADSDDNSAEGVRTHDALLDAVEALRHE